MARVLEDNEMIVLEEGDEVETIYDDFPGYNDLLPFQKQMVDSLRVPNSMFVHSRRIGKSFIRNTMEERFKEQYLGTFAGIDVVESPLVSPEAGTIEVRSMNPMPRLEIDMLNRTRELIAKEMRVDMDNSFRERMLHDMHFDAGSRPSMLIYDDVLTEEDLIRARHRMDQQTIPNFRRLADEQRRQRRQRPTRIRADGKKIRQ